MLTTVDLNCDMGESFGAYKLGMDEAVIQMISSANVACGFHGGDPDVMNRTVELARSFDVGVGAHPGYPDLNGFGRRFVDMERNEVINMIVYQIGALQAFCNKHKVRLQHVKLHGALANRVDIDEELANYAADAVLAFNPELPVFVNPNSLMHKVLLEKKLHPILEVYADRAYNDDLTLVSRKLTGAVITDPDLAAKRALKMVAEGKVTTITGNEVDITGQTICVHGDTPTALNMISKIRLLLKENGVGISSFKR
ncbi:LamB/YcsF family protein [Paenibacillus sp. WQ 127069]|uniref:5-oxoprolinase subunit A n=1 Tax=Paenibacillus baimaensis TaxID=2982185 RepID=A0ABT2UML8_9BACL|nr:5-oxoprolinase subunit PxpA [Paenibacillus sp. WQ 127069]MCU6795893.1 LamB/YcsF family protein [Paenibacillus sp. WQ 127069]